MSNENRDELGRFAEAEAFAKTDAAFSYTSSGYHDIKQADKGKLLDPRAKKYADEINAYIAKTETVRPKLYRGMNVTTKQLGKIKANGALSLDSITSFSDSESSAMSFARGSSGYDSGEHVVVVASGVKASPIIGRVFTGEKEYVARKGAALKIRSIEQRGRVTVIHTEAADARIVAAAKIKKKAVM